MLNQTQKWRPNSLFSDKAASYVSDLQVAKLRNLLREQIDSCPANGGENDGLDYAEEVALRGQNIELLLRIGVLCGSPEDLLLAAMYQ